MAVNKLTPEHDLKARGIFRQIADDDTFLSVDARSTILGTLLKELNYKWLPNGSFVSRDTSVSVPFGTVDYSAFKDEWEDDEERANEAIDNKDTVEASTSSEAEDSEVREAILSEDVQ